jgi:hypothetical protein
VQLAFVRRPTAAPCDVNVQIPILFSLPHPPVFVPNFIAFFRKFICAYSVPVHFHLSSISNDVWFEKSDFSKDTTPDSDRKINVMKFAFWKLSYRPTPAQREQGLISVLAV